MFKRIWGVYYGGKGGFHYSGCHPSIDSVISHIGHVDEKGKRDTEAHIFRDGTYHSCISLSGEMLTNGGF
jgi:hypothetical protein